LHTIVLKNLDYNMAIEIKELIVRVTVNNSAPKTASESKILVNSMDRKEIIKECVEKVLEKLELKSLR
jgi:hypothetical protein